LHHAPSACPSIQIMAVEAKASKAMAVGALAGCALLLFAGALLASSNMGLIEEATATLRGRNLGTVADQLAGTTPASIVENGKQAMQRRLNLRSQLGNFLPTQAVPLTPAPDITVQTNVAVTTWNGSITILVTKADTFVNGQWVTIGGVNPGSTTPENRHIKAIDTTSNTLTFYKPLQFNHQQGEVVILEPESLTEQLKNQLSSGGHGTSGKSMISSESSASSLGSSDSLKSFESGSSQGDLLKAGAYMNGATTMGSCFGNFILCMCFACVYKSKVVDPMGTISHQPLQHEMHNDFNYGLFDCCKDPNICLMTCCCPFVRMAHTNEAADVCGFWESLVCMWCSGLCPCGPLCLQVYFRIHIKDHMGIHDHCFMDFVAAFFCLFCVTAQQAMSVDEALGFKFKCPCSIERSSGSLYGQE